ncbi:phage portal protein [Glutamicibacter uratoxydans]|uniref:phage portal protein n=1 Tax=Glutamicibacter uratoxydans TaxID=43667 RepID=UPI003D6DCD6E
MNEMMIKSLSEKLDQSQPVLRKLDSYWCGQQPAAYLSKGAREALGTSLTGLAVNFPKLAVTALAERLNITGFRAQGDGAEPSPDLWKIWNRNRMDDGSAQAHIDALVYGRSFVMVWAGPRGPQITVESPHQIAVHHDPVSHQVTAAFKRWAVNGQAHGVLYLADQIHTYRSSSNVVDGAFPATNWDLVETIANPFGVVPVVPIVNRGRLMDLDGVSEMTDIMGLSDALNKLSADAMVSSEFYARPRRWATGLELAEDDDGNVIQPFSDEAGKLWISEDTETKFGQFDGSRLDGYSDLMQTVTQQIGALSGLPPHYLGLYGDQPPSADSIRSAEASLVSRVYTLQRIFGNAWEQVAALVLAVKDGVDPLDVELGTVWAGPETRTPAQAADAAVKLKTMGVPLSIVLEDSLGYSPAQLERVRTALRAEALDTAGVNLTELVQ